MSSVMNFDKSYPELASFNNVIKAYDDQFFAESSLIFVGISAPQPHTDTMLNIFRNQKVLFR